MARPKKNAAQAQDTLLTLDTVPEIPVEEQPYPLPEGWKWVRLGNIVSVSKEKMEDFSSPALRYIGLEHFEKDHGLTGFTLAKGIRSIKNVFYPGQVLYGKLRPYLNKHDIASFYGVCSTDILVFECSNIINNKFLNYALNLNYFISYAVENSKGINLPRVSEKIILDAYFPLPPLEVQQRIVERIETLFAKLDEAREKAESALESFERRKAAILHKAFTGELTRTWRKIQQVSHAAWENKTFGTLVANSRLGLVRSKAEQGCQFKYKYLKMNNITSEGIISIKEITNVNASKQEVEQYELKYGDFIFNTRNSFELVGKSAVFNYYENNILYNNNIMRVNFIQNTNPFYINYFLYSPKGKFQLKKIKKNTTNVAAIYAKDLNLIKIPLASFIEQQEIVRILDRIFAREQQAREAAENVLQRIDQMKKAILARAFRGELG